MAESIVVEIYEHEVYESKEWKEYLVKPWVMKSCENEESPPPDEICLPGADWGWLSNWKIHKKAGETDGDGWEYASKIQRFYSVKNRIPKPSQAEWSDKARRRLWQRLTRKDGGGAHKQVDVTKVIPHIQQGLGGVHSARMQIEEIVKKMGRADAATNPQMKSLAQKVKQNIADLLKGLDQMEQQEDASNKKSSPYTAVIKKLRNDCSREETAIDAALGITPTPITATEKKRGSFFRRPSANANASTNSNSNATNNNSNNNGNNNTSSSSTIPENGNVGDDETVRGTGVEKEKEDLKVRNSGVRSSNKAGNVRGAYNHNSGNNSFDESVDNGYVGPEKAPWRPKAHMHATKGLMSSHEEWDSEDGIFKDRQAHELAIEQKLVPIDQATVMQELIDERALEIEKMHKGIVEVNEMFVDLGKIVQLQDGEINAIFENADESAVKTAEAFKHVVQADKLQRDGQCVVM